MATLRAIFAAFRLAFLSVLRAKLRAALTVLGILIGIAAVVSITALGTGARESIAQKVQTMGANMLTVYSQRTQKSGAKTKTAGRLTEADAKAIRRECTSVATVAPNMSSSGQVIYGDQNVSTSLVGSTSAYIAVKSFKLAEGSVWTDGDERSKAKLVLLGATVATNLFGNQSPIGETLRIGVHPFKVIGVFEKKGANAQGSDQDDFLLMPVGVFRSRIKPTAPGRVDQILVSATDARTVERARKQIETLLRQRHGIADIEQPDFDITTQAEAAASQEQIYSILSVLLVAVAAVSLFVGGIGVMNIMLVSVTERTREIGIRMAIGASEATILLQFLVESLVLCLIGGAAGTGLGLIIVAIASRALEWPMVFPMQALLIALGTSLVIGLVFGFFPARRAARLDPIDALREE
jgi:putative ABC transport system permease protein